MKKSKMTPEQIEARKHARKAKSMTAASQKSYGPLFAELAPTYTPDDAFWHWRKIKANMAELGGLAVATAMERFIVGAIERYAAGVLGDAFEPVRDAIRKTFAGSPQQQHHAWCGLLTRGNRVIFGYRRECRDEWKNEWNLEGVRCFETGSFPPANWTVLLSHEEFKARFPGNWMLNDFEETAGNDDPAALFEKLFPGA